MSLLAFFLQDDSSIDPISFSKIARFDSKDYTAFGNIINQGGDSIFWYGRNATSHIAGGEIAKIEYQPSTSSIVKSLNVISNAVNIQGESIGIVDGNIFVFVSLFNGTSFTDLGYYKSNDGLTGESFDSFVSLSSFLIYAFYNFYGETIKISDSIYISPWYEHDEGTSDIWRPNFIKTVDSGDNWTNHNISAEVAPNDIGETSLLYLGDNNLFAIGRRRTSNFKLRQNYSTDLGATWGGWQETNLGSQINQCMPYLYLNKKGLVDCVYGDRGTTWVRISIDNALTIVSNPTQWNAPKNLYASDSGESFAPLGYPSITEISQGRYLAFLSQETKDTATNTEADLYVGDGHLDDL